jgi:hypothetical protein
MIKFCFSRPLFIFAFAIMVADLERDAVRGSTTFQQAG